MEQTGGATPHNVSSMSLYSYWRRVLVPGLGIALLYSNLTASGATVTNRMQGFQFNPRNMTINVGDTVVWINANRPPPIRPPEPRPILPPNHFAARDFFVGGGSCSHTFTSAGNFGYFCTLHSPSMFAGTLTVLAPPNNPPSVSLTNPANGSKFIAPASFPLTANANDSDGNVTNVQFFSGGSLLGSDSTFPYTFNVNLAAGNYSFTARASDNLGAASTSSVVNVSVLTNALLISPLRQTGGQFQFTILTITGQTYTTEVSTNLINWTPIATNVAPSNSFKVTDSLTNLPQRFYRTRQDL